MTNFYAEHGLMGQAYEYAYDELKWKNKEAFKEKHKYLGKEKLECLVEDLQDHKYYLCADKITIFGEHHPLAEYINNNWEINIFPDKDFNKNRIYCCIDLKNTLSKYEVSYNIKNIKEIKEAIINYKKELDNMIDLINF